MGLQLVTTFYLTDHGLTVALGAVLCMRFGIKPRRCYSFEDELTGAATCWTPIELQIMLPLSYVTATKSNIWMTNGPRPVWWSWIQISVRRLAILLKIYLRLLQYLHASILTLKYLCIELWGCASKTNVDIIQRYQSKLLRIITNAPWYVTNQTRHSDLRIQTVTSVRNDYTRKHRSTLEHHPNPAVKPLLLYAQQTRRLKRCWTFDAIYWGVVTGHTPGPPWKYQHISL
jgi:hypothetical protein